MDQTHPDHRRSISSGSISSAYLDRRLPLRRNELSEASSFMEFGLDDDTTHGFPRNSIALTSLRRTSRSLSPYDTLEQESDPGTATPQPHHGEVPDVPSQYPLVANKREKCNVADAHALRWKRLFRDWWLWEILGALLSACCMVAVVILGLHLDGLSLSDWTFFMEPSTIISTLITVAKTSMLLPVAEGLSQLKWVYFLAKKRPLSELEAFDDASRGPWGSIMFFWKIKASSLLALCGAFLTVASLAIGPFAQQIISIETRTIPRVGANASTWVTNTFADTRHISVFISEADPEIQAAAYSGLLKPGQPFEYNCASGNCTWPDIHSLGVCSTCIDVTSTVAADVTDDFINITAHEGSIPIMRYSEGTNTAIIAGNASVGDVSGPVIINFTIAQFKHPYEDEPFFSASAPWDNFRNHWNIVECSITWCVKQYRNLKIIHGAVHDFDVQDILVETRGGHYENDLMWFWMETKSEIWENRTVAMPPFQNESLAVSWRATNGLSLYLGKLFSFSAWNNVTDLSRAAVGLIYPANVSAVVAGAADSLTNVLRTRSATVAHGTIWDQGTYYSIKWVWITLPIALVFLSTIFLVVTSLVNTQHTAPLWKSGLLPYLFHGPGSEWWEDDERRELREGLLEQKYDMEDRAKGIAARLRRTGEGETRFVRD